MNVSVRTMGLWVVLLFSGCSRGEKPAGGVGVGVEGAWVRALPSMSETSGIGGNSAAYLSLENHGDSTVWLVGGSTPVASAVEVHATRMDGEVVRMRRVEELPLPPGETIELRPGGLHLMLVGLNRSLHDGEMVDLTLHFKGAPDMPMRVPVKFSEGG